MAEATNIQMQMFADNYVRPGAESVRDVLARLKASKASIGDIYERANGANPWSDARSDGPPHLLNSASMLQWNSFITDVIAAIEEHGEWGNVQLACVRAV